MKKKQIISTIAVSCIASSIGFSAHAIIDAVISSQKVYVNSQEVNIEAYNIDGSNYYKLRDLGDTLGFSVDYDEGSNSVMINTGNDQDQSETIEFYYEAADGTKYYPGDIYTDEKGDNYLVDDMGDLVYKYELNGETPITSPQPGLQVYG